MAKEYEVIVVGGGNAGLAAACAMSKMGIKTLLLEKHNLPGGCATSFVRGRFEFEASLHNLPGVGERAKNGDIGQMYERFGVKRKFYPIPESLHFIADDEGKRFEFKAGVGREAFAVEAEKACPGCRPALERFYAMCDCVNGALEMMSRAKGKPNPKTMAAKYPNYLRLASSTVDEMFMALEFPERLKKIVGLFALYQCGDTSKIDAARFAVMADSFIRTGACQTDMRSFGLSTALVNSAKSFGCDIWYNSEIVKICTEGGAVSGVLLSDGTKLRAKRVLCNIIPHIAYSRLLEKEDIPPLELKKANVRELGAKGFCVFLGLDADYKSIGIKDYAAFINSSLVNSDAIKGTASRDTNLDMSVNCLNAVVPDASPEGTCIVYLTSMFTGDSWEDVMPENYTAIKEDMADRLIDRCEKVMGIDLRSHIEEIVISTPVTYARYLGTPQGAVFGYSASDWDGMMSRNMGEAAEPTVPGLYFAGGHGSRLSGFSPSYMNGFTTGMRIFGEIRAEKGRGFIARFGLGRKKEGGKA